MTRATAAGVCFAKQLRHSGLKLQDKQRISRLGGRSKCSSRRFPDSNRCNPSVGIYLSHTIYSQQSVDGVLCPYIGKLRLLNAVRVDRRCVGWLTVDLDDSDSMISIPNRIGFVLVVKVIDSSGRDLDAAQVVRIPSCLSQQECTTGRLMAVNRMHTQLCC
jgi:hypothetical protein